MIFLKEKRKKIMYINLATHTSQLQYNADKHNVISCIIYCNSRLLLLFTQDVSVKEWYRRKNNTNKDNKTEIYYNIYRANPRPQRIAMMARSALKNSEDFFLHVSNTWQTFKTSTFFSFFFSFSLFPFSFFLFNFGVFVIAVTRLQIQPTCKIYIFLFVCLSCEYICFVLGLYSFY